MSMRRVEFEVIAKSLYYKRRNYHSNSGKAYFNAPPGFWPMNYNNYDDVTKQKEGMHHFWGQSPDVSTVEMNKFDQNLHLKDISHTPRHITKISKGIL